MLGRSRSSRPDDSGLSEIRSDDRRQTFGAFAARISEYLPGGGKYSRAVCRLPYFACWDFLNHEWSILMNLIM